MRFSSDSIPARNRGWPASGAWARIRRMARLFVFLLLLLPLLAQAEERQEFWRAEFIHDLSVSATPPRADDPRWHTVALPYAVRNETALARGGWFRVHVHRDTLPTGPIGLYVWWLNLNAAFYFNYEFLGDGGRFDEPISRNWNRPFLFLLHASHWRVGDNVLLIHLLSDPGWGLLSPFEVGDYEPLSSDFRQRRFFQVELTQGLTLMLLVAASLILAVWWRRREPQYLWFGLACLMWAIFSSYLVVRDPVIPGPLFRWLSHLALDTWAVCMVLFVNRYLGLRRPRLEHALAYFPLFSGALSALPMLWQGYAFLISHLITFGLIVWLTLVTARHWWRGRWREHAMLLTGLLALLLAGSHDLLTSLPWQWLSEESAHVALKHHLILFNHAAPVVLLFLTGHLGRRFTDALTEAEVLNRELETRVEASRAALAESYAERSALERETAIAEERERIYRDMHDDLGAKLLSLAIRAGDAETADIARAALQDLRDVVSRSSSAEAMLLDLLADRRSEIAARTASAKLRLLWNQQEDLPDSRLSASQALHLGRILREAVSNVLRHAGAENVVVSIHRLGAEYQISIEDDGRNPPRNPGRGMRNMSARAEQLGGHIEWIWGEGGCRVELVLPAFQNGKVTVT